MNVCAALDNIWCSNMSTFHRQFLFGTEAAVSKESFNLKHPNASVFSVPFEKLLVSTFLYNLRILDITDVCKWTSSWETETKVLTESNLRVLLNLQTDAS